MTTQSQALSLWTDDLKALRAYARNGDPQAFEAIIARYEAMVLSTCQRVLVNRADAEDATQETFLKLAQRASKVRSNVAAWLHACARRTAIDHVRRLGARRRAEQKLHQTESSATRDEPDVNLIWRELEPRLDAALEALNEPDREILVSHFLVGRSQAELARQAGIHAGTMSRRIQNALDRLRATLRQEGVAVASLAALTQGLAPAYAAGVAQPSASLIKIGLMGIAQTGVLLAATKGTGTLASAILIGLILLVGGVWSTGLFSPGSHQPAELIPAEGYYGPARPRVPSNEFELISNSYPAFRYGGAVIRADRIELITAYDPIENQIAKLILERLGTDRVGDSTVILTRVLAETTLSSSPPRFTIGEQLDLRFAIDPQARLRLEPLASDQQLGANEPAWFGVRPPPDWPEHTAIPIDADATGVLGPWARTDRWPVVLGPYEIRIGTTNWQAARYQVINWEQGETFSRLETVYTNGWDEDLIGTRFAMILRQEGSDYELAYFPEETRRSADYPTSFLRSSTNPIQILRFIPPVSF
ncbi:MAG: sigma-70 family RNA polymerase sigma factor [Phycisphaeraceae bacterium]